MDPDCSRVAEVQEAIEDADTVKLRDLLEKWKNRPKPGEVSSRGCDSGLPSRKKLFAEAATGRLTALFRKYDSDSSGKITIAEVDELESLSPEERERVQRERESEQLAQLRQPLQRR